MSTYLVDTNVLINALNRKQGHRELLRDQVAQGHRLATCTVILAELFSGVKPADLSTIEAFASTLTWYPATPSIARRAGRLRYEYARQGLTIGLPDLLIAAIALEHGLTLLTANRKDFPMPELALYPLKES